MSVILTDEQERLIELAREGKNVLVNACIGSGKTTTIQQLCDELDGEGDIVYLTYNKLLKLDAKKKIKNFNTTVQNYHGFAYMVLSQNKIPTPAQSQLIKLFNTSKIKIDHIDTLILDEYQDIDKEISEMLIKIKKQNPRMQIIAVGDMDQKIYDWTSLDVREFINDFLGEHEELTFSNCFRLSERYAKEIGLAWQKEIKGVNEENEISELIDYKEAVDIMLKLNPKDILCLGQRTGNMALALNELEAINPTKFNKKTVYASIMDNGESGSVNPNSNCAIFTTFDGSKGMERNYCFIFDYTPSYWVTRMSKPNAKTSIMRNVFLVAASRGKKNIYFVRGRGNSLLDFEFLQRETEHENINYDNVIFDASEMFSFKYKEDVEECFNMLKITCVQDTGTRIETPKCDELIDLSPVIGVYQQACFFENYNIQNVIDYKKIIHDDKVIKAGKTMSLEKKILALVASDTSQERYLTQVNIPFISNETVEKIKERLRTKFDGKENVEKTMHLTFDCGKFDINMAGRIDVEKDGNVYELKFVEELSYEHFLQCAMYLIMGDYANAYLWNVKNNQMYKVEIPNESKFMNKVLSTITKGKIKEFKRLRKETF